MRLFIRLLFGLMAGGLLALGQPSVALANGGHVHFGDINIPFVVVWVGGGLIVVLLLLFCIGWSYSSQAKRRSQRGEKEGNPQEVKKEK